MLVVQDTAPEGGLLGLCSDTSNAGFWQQVHDGVARAGIVLLRSSSTLTQDILSPGELVGFLKQLHAGGEAELPKFSASSMESEYRVDPRGDGSVPGYPRLRRLGNVPGALFCETGLEWHSDGVGSWTALHCHKTPIVGGETLFADSSVVFERLSPSQKAQAMATQIVYSWRFTAGRWTPSAVDFRHGLRMSPFGTKLLKPVRYHTPEYEKLVQRDPTCGRFTMPLVRTKQGKPCIIIDIRHVEYVLVNGQPLSVRHSRDWVDRILQAGLGAEKPPSQFCKFRKVALSNDVQFDRQTVHFHRWQPGDLLVWDNDKILHSPASTCNLGPGRELIQTIYRVRK